MPLLVHTFIRENRDDIVREWEASIQAEPRVVTLAGALLRNELPVLLDELADWMEQNDGTKRMRTAGINHASQRLDHGFQITQLIDEMGVLRTTILRMLLTAETEGSRRGNTDLPDVLALARLNAGLDQAIADTVKYFVDERERRLAELSSREIALVRESDQRKSDFLAVLSHELRNPLAPILNAVQILTHAEANTEQSVRATGVIERQTQHLTRLVDDLLDLSRISHGKISLHNDRFDLREVVRATCDDLRSLVEQRGVTLRLDIAAGPVWIEGDPVRIAQVTSNLLHNAAKFTPHGGLLNVAIAVHGQRASLHVRDNGVGMELALIGNLFEPFMQGVQDSSRPTGGLGLGLALVKGLVTLHGGTVSARSDGANLGSEFIVELPLVDPPPDVACRAPAASPSRLVLLIEDNFDTGDSLAMLLELSGHRVRVARDGRSGIALALEHQPDIIVCDIGLPDMKGFEVARELRSSGRLPATRLVALSGYAQAEDRQRSEEAGFDAHLVKPVAFHKLNELLAGATSSK